MLLRNLGQRDAVLYSGVLFGCDHQHRHDAIWYCTHCLLSYLPWGFPDSSVGKESALVVSQDVLCLVLEENEDTKATLFSWLLLLLLLSHFSRVWLCVTPETAAHQAPVPGILQARTLEWVAISFSNAWKWKVKVKSLSRLRLLVTPRTAAYQAPLSMGFSRQEYWSGLPLPSPLFSWRIYQIWSQCCPGESINYNARVVDTGRSGSPRNKATHLWIPGAWDTVGAS